MLGRWQEGHPACKKLSGVGAGVVICLERGADLHMAQLMPLPLTVSCFSKIQIGFTFLVPAHLGSTGKRAGLNGCVCVCVSGNQYQAAGLEKIKAPAPKSILISYSLYQNLLILQYWNQSQLTKPL